MTGRGSAVGAARLLCAAAAARVGACSASAQASARQPPPPPDPAELDPNAPLAPMPDLGVAWPDLNASETTPTADCAAPLRAGQKPPSETPPTATGDIRYTSRSKALAPSAALKTCSIDSGSSRRSRPSASIRPMPHRSGAVPAPTPILLEELLRSQGYYDAAGRAADRKAGDTLRVILTADPGEQYRFASVELPGLEAAGPDAAKLRDTFAVKAGDPVIAADVIAGGAALTPALGEQGFASAKIGEQDVEVNHQTHLATLTLPVNPGPVARFGAIRVSGRPPFSAHHVGDHRAVQAGRSVQAVEDRRSAPRADRRRDWSRMPISRSCRCRAGGPSTSTSGSSPRRRTRSPASSATAPGRALGSRPAGPPQFLQSRRRADAARGRAAPASSCRRPVPALQFPPAGPDPQPAALGVAPEVRRL